MSQVWSASHVLGAKQNSQGRCVSSVPEKEGHQKK